MRWMILAATFFASPALAQDPERLFAWHLTPAGPPWETRSLTVDCFPQGEDELLCWLTWINLRVRVPPEKVDEEIGRAIAAFRADVAERGYAAAVERRCFPEGEVQALRDAVARGRAEGRPRAAKRLADLVEACAAATQESLESFLRQAILDDAKTCLVDWERENRIRMRRVASHAWEGTSESADCGSSHSHRLERNAERSSLLTWSLTRTAGDTSREECSAPPLGVRREFSYRRYPPELSCEFVDFGRW